MSPPGRLRSFVLRGVAGHPSAGVFLSSRPGHVTLPLSPLTAPARSWLSFRSAFPREQCTVPSGCFSLFFVFRRLITVCLGVFVGLTAHTADVCFSWFRRLASSQTAVLPRVTGRAGRLQRSLASPVRPLPHRCPAPRGLPSPWTRWGRSTRTCEPVTLSGSTLYGIRPAS